MKPESTVQKEILKFLKEIGCYSIKTVRSNRKGIPDIICCFEGRFIAIEVKKEAHPNWKPSELQKLELGKCNDSGGFGFCANNLDYVKNIFDAYLMEL